MQRPYPVDILTVIFLLMITSLTPSHLSAQSIWLEHGWDKSIAAEYLRPDFTENQYIAQSVSIFFISLRHPISEKTLFVMELPIAHASFSSDFYDDSQTTIANPYIGVETRKPGSRSSMELGFRLPVMSRDQTLASSSGRVVDYDRYEAFLPRVIAFTGKGNFRWISASNKLGARLRLGPTIWFSTALAGGAELFFDYSFQVGYLIRKVILTSGLTGRFFASGGFVDLSERFVHQFGLAASAELGSIRPGIHFRIPLDEDVLEAIDFVFGLNIGITFD
jgi:hypothetical protein